MPRTPVVEPVTTDAETQAAFRRIEAKYLFQHTTVDDLRSLLEGSCQRIVHRHSVSTVRSIYFDDHRYEACRANLDGLARRHKMRLRWYDTKRPTDVAFLEVKWRRNRVTGKDRYPIQFTRPFGEIEFRDLADDLVRILPPTAVPFVLRYPDPVVLVEYKREHFIASDPRYRLTLDYDLRYYDQTGARRVRDRFGITSGEEILIEAKAPVGQETQLSRFFRPLSVRPSRSSKYIRGCLSIGVVRTLG